MWSGNLKFKPLNFHKLSVQLSLVTLGISTLVLGLFGYYSIQARTVKMEKELEQFIQFEITQLATILSPPFFNFDDASCRTICQATLKKPEIIKIDLYDKEHSYHLSYQDDSDEYERLRLKTRKAVHPIQYSGQVIGSMEMEATTFFFDQEIKRMSLNSIIQVITVNLILGLALMLILNLKFIKPLKHLIHASKEIASGNLDQPINMQRHDELGELSQHLIEMRNAVKEKVESLEAESSQHQKTSLALEKSESFMRFIIDMIPHQIFVRNRAGELLIVNQALADQLNSEVKNLTGRHYSEILANRIMLTQMEQDNEYLLTYGKSATILTQTGKDNDKNTHWYSTRKIPFVAPDGETGVIGVTSDISDLKQAEQELTRTKNYINNIINSMPSALFSVDRDLAVTLWNDQAQSHYGINTRDAISRPLIQMLPKMKPYTDSIQETISAGHPCLFSKQASRRSGKTIFEDITVYPLLGKEIEGAVIRVDDVTEQVRMEEMVIQSEKMLSIGGLAAGMAHEVNNPLAGMMQNAQLVLRRIQEDIPSSIRVAEEVGLSMGQIRSFFAKRGIIKQLEQIHAAGIRASQIVQNMLSFSRISSSEKTPASMADLMDSTIELAGSDYDLKKQYDFKKIEIIRDYEPDTPPVCCEVSKIQQVFFNILKNSSEAMQEVQDKRPPVFTLRIRKIGKYVQIEIQDNGPGIPPENLGRVFEPFFTTKPVGKGTGLGLSVSYFIVTKNHNGKMNVVSEKAGGTTFIIQLPL